MGVEYYKPIFVMIGCQFLYAGTNLFVRAALLEHMSSSVFVVYRQFIGFLLISPFAFLSRKGINGCCMNWKSFSSIFLLSLVGVTANHNAYYLGMSLVTSSVASAMYNLAPAITFIMAYTMGLEKVNLKSWGSIAKIIGTLVCVSGAAIMALLQGPKLLNMELGGVDDKSRLLGCLLIFASSCFWSLALILQAHVNEWYPDFVSMTAWMCLMASLQSGVYTLLVEPSMDAWKLSSPLEIISCIFAGMTSAVTFFAQAWCVARRGPLFSALFQPLCTVIVTVLGYIFLHEDLYVGRRRGIKGSGLGWKSFWQISLLAFIGITLTQNLYFVGLYLASAAATSALCNLIPAITFLLAYLLGLEKVDLGSWRSLAKIIGTVFCVSGAAAMTLFKGPHLLKQFMGDGGNNTWILGCLFIFSSTFSWSLWLILQGHVSASYPDHARLTAWTCLFAAIQSAIVAFFIHPTFHAWKLTSPLQLFACLFAGLTSAVTVFAQAWCIAKRGPLFSAMFNPLCTLIVTIFACIFMHEELYTGSLIGGVGVIIGLYTVLWGKAREYEEMNGRKKMMVGDDEISTTLDLEHPLLS